MRDSSFFDGVAQADIDSILGRSKLPVFYYDTHMMLGAFPARYTALCRAMPDPRFVPARLAPGLGMVAVSCVEHRDTDIGAYNELAVAVPLSYPGWRVNLPGRALLEGERYGQLHAFVLQLPVTSEKLLVPAASSSSTSRRSSSTSTSRRPAGAASAGWPRATRRSCGSAVVSCPPPAAPRCSSSSTRGWTGSLRVQSSRYAMWHAAAACVRGRRPWSSARTTVWRASSTACSFRAARSGTTSTRTSKRSCMDPSVSACPCCRS